MNNKRKIIDRAVERFSDCLSVCGEQTNLEELSKFQREYFGNDSRQASSTFTKWAFLSPRAGRLRVCERDGEFVGQQGELVATLCVGDVETPAVWGVDLRVRPEWKMKGLGVALIGSLMKNSPVVLVLGVSDEARKMFTRQGWLDFGLVDSYFKPVSGPGYSRVHSKDTMLAKAARNIVAAVSGLVDRTILFASELVRDDHSIERFDRFDPTFDALLIDCMNNYSVSCARTVDFLNWRYVECPLDNDYELYKVRANGDLVGFVVMCKGDRNGKRTLFIDELISLPKYTQILVDSVIKAAYEREMDGIYYQGLDAVLTRVLRRRLFVRRSGGPRLMAYCEDEELKAQFDDRSHWRISYADSDSGFCLDS